MASSSSTALRLLVAYAPEFVLGGIARVIWGRVFPKRHELHERFKQTPARTAPAPTSFPHSGLMVDSVVCFLDDDNEMPPTGVFSPTSAAAAVPAFSSVPTCTTDLSTFVMPHTVPPTQSILPVPALSSSPPKTSSIHEASRTVQTIISPPSVPAPSQIQSETTQPFPFPTARLAEMLFLPAVLAGVLLILFMLYAKWRQTHPAPKRKRTILRPRPALPERVQHLRREALGWRIPRKKAVTAAPVQDAPEKVTAQRAVYVPPHKRARAGLELRARLPLADIANDNKATRVKPTEISAQVTQTPALKHHRLQMLPTPDTLDRLPRRRLASAVALNHETPTRAPRQ